MGLSLSKPTLLRSGPSESGAAKAPIHSGTAREASSGEPDLARIIDIKHKTGSLPSNTNDEELKLFHQHQLLSLAQSQRGVHSKIGRQDKLTPIQAVTQTDSTMRYIDALLGTNKKQTQIRIDATVDAWRYIPGHYFDEWTWKRDIPLKVHKYKKLRIPLYIRGLWNPDREIKAVFHFKPKSPSRITDIQFGFNVSGEYKYALDHSETYTVTMEQLPDKLYSKTVTFQPYQDGMRINPQKQKVEFKVNMGATEFNLNHSARVRPKNTASHLYRLFFVRLGFL